MCINIPLRIDVCAPHVTFSLQTLFMRINNESKIISSLNGITIS